VVVVRGGLSLHPPRPASARPALARQTPPSRPRRIGIGCPGDGRGALTMDCFRSLAEVPAGFGPSAVTIGKFDGVHAGHRAVIGALRSIADPLGLVPTVVTFDRHPLALLDPGSAPEALLSNRQKVERLAAAGVAATLMLPFDEEFAA